MTGTLWAPIERHALGDYGRRLKAGDGQDHTTGTDAVVETIIIVLAAAVLVSVIREDARTRERGPAGMTSRYAVRIVRRRVP